MSRNILGTALQAIVHLSNGGFIGTADLNNILRILQDLQEDPHKSFHLKSLLIHCRTNQTVLNTELREITQQMGLCKPEETDLSRETKDVIVSCVQIQGEDINIIPPSQKK